MVMKYYSFVTQQKCSCTSLVFLAPAAKHNHLHHIVDTFYAINIFFYLLAYVRFVKCDVMCDFICTCAHTELKVALR
jgi:hypothetical protein